MSSNEGHNSNTSEANVPQIHEKKNKIHEETKSSIAAGIARAFARPLGAMYRRPVALFNPPKFEPFVYVKNRAEKIPQVIVEEAPSSHAKRVKLPNNITNIHQIIKGEGIISLIRTLLPPLVFNSISGSALFGVYHSFLRYNQDDTIVSQEIQSPLQYDNIFAAGAISGIVQSIISAPMDTIKARMLQAPHNQYFTDCMIDTWKKYGLIGGFYQGMGVTWIRDMLGYGAFFLSYEWTKRNVKSFLNAHGIEKGDNALSVLIGGGVAGCSLQLLRHPLDVFKTSLILYNTSLPSEPTTTTIVNSTDSIVNQAPPQTLNEMEQKSNSGKKRFGYKNSMHFAQQVIQTKGYKYFSNGLLVSLSRSFPAAALGFLVYELTLKQFVE